MQRRPSQFPATPTAYRIRVQGCIASQWSDWFCGLTLAEELDASGQPVTTLTGAVPDQPALRGILNKLWDLNLTLITAERLTKPVERERTHDRHADPEVIEPPSGA